MRIPKSLVGGLFLCLLIVCAGVFFNPPPASAAGETCSNGSAAPCTEDIQLNGCILCHSGLLTGGNRNGTDRQIFASIGSVRHQMFPRRIDWTSHVNSMISKGSPAILELTAGYLNTNYCTDCTGVIISSPVVVNIQDTSASITWSTSLNDFGDGPADSVVFYGTNPAALTGQASDSTMTGAHSVKLTGLNPSTRYYFQYQSTGADGKTVKYNFDTPFFRTKPCATCGGGTTTFAYVANQGSNSISVVDVDKGTLQTTIPLTETPWSVVASPDGKTVYVSTFTGNTIGPNISVIDTATNAITSTTHITDPIPNGGTQLRLAISPDGQYLFGAHWSDTLLTLSAADLSVIKSTPLTECGGLGCADIAVSPDGVKIYVVAGSYGSATVMIDAASAIDPSVTTDVIPVTLPGNPGAYAVAAGPDERAWISGVYGGAPFSVVNPDATTATVAGMYAGSSVAVSKLGDSVYAPEIISNYDFQIEAYDTVSLKTQHSISGIFGNYQPTGTAVTADGLKLLVAAYCDPVGTCPGLLYIVDTDTLGILVSIPMEIRPNKIALSMAPAISPPMSDVLMTNVISNAATVSAGNTLSVTDTVKNQGTGITDSSFFIGYRLSATPNYDDPFAVVITTTRAAGPLAAGTTDTGTTNLLIPGTTAAGFYYVCAKADSTGVLAESDADNNTQCSAGTIEVVRPDLVMTAVTPNAGSFAPGGTLSVTDTVQNVGGPFTGVSFSIAYSLSADTTYGNSDDVMITTTRAVGSLGTGASSTATTNLLIPTSIPAGTYHVCAKADSTGAVSETNETNNSLCSTLTVGPSVPDLVMTVVSTTATTAAPSGSFTLSNSAKNQGSASAGSFTIAFHLSVDQTYGGGDDIAFTTTRTVSSLAAGSTSTASTSLAVPSGTALGNYYVCATADSANSVLEGDETNNARCTTTTIQVTRPDLIMTAVTPNAATVSATATLSVTDSAKNQGTVSAGSFKVGYRLSLNTTYGDDVAITTTRTVSSLAGGISNTATTTLSIPNTTPSGLYYVCAKADSANAVTELDETNNTLCSPGTVTVPAADLLMTAVSTATAVVAPSKTLSLSNTAKNRGLFPAGAFTIAFHLSANTTYGDGDDIAFTATRSVTSLASGASSAGTTTLTIPAATPFGTYSICAHADSGNTVSESDEANNSLCTATTVQVSSPDLVMTAVTPGAATATKGGTLSVANTVQNQGPLATGAFRIGYRLSVNTTYGDADDVVITTTRTVTSLAAGASNTAATTLSIPLSTPSGPYYVCVKADSLAQVTETNENNNTLCSGSQVTVP